MSIEHPRQSVEAELARFLRHDAQRTDREAGLVAELIAAVKRIRGFEGIAGTTAIGATSPFPTALMKVGSSPFADLHHSGVHDLRPTPWQAA